jgi:hypothetical protein
MTVVLSIFKSFYYSFSTFFSNSRTSKLNLKTKFDSMYMLYKLQYQRLYKYKVLQQIIWVYMGMEFNT